MLRRTESPWTLLPCARVLLHLFACQCPFLHAFAPWTADVAHRENSSLKSTLTINIRRKIISATNFIRNGLSPIQKRGKYFCLAYFLETLSWFKSTKMPAIFALCELFTAVALHSRQSLGTMFANWPAHWDITAHHHLHLCPAAFPAPPSSFSPCTSCPRPLACLPL